jgi:large subunit ribosomal protein L23
VGQVKNPYDVIIKPHITEKSVALSYGDAKIREEKNLVRKYTFIVADGVNKLEIKAAFEAIYNDGKKKDDCLKVTSVNTVILPGKLKKRGKSSGMTKHRRKAVITLDKGQVLEEYGV